MKKGLYLTFLTFLFTLLLSSSLARAEVYNGKALDNPWVDSGYEPKIKGAGITYQDVLIPYDMTMAEIGGTSKYVYRTSSTYENNLFYEIQNQDKKYFGQTAVREFGKLGVVCYVAKKIPFTAIYNNATCYYVKGTSGSDPHLDIYDRENGTLKKKYDKAAEFLDDLDKGVLQLQCEIHKGSSSTTGYIKYDKSIPAVYLSIDNVPFYFNAFGTYSVYIGEVLQKDSIKYKPESENWYRIVDLILVDGTTIHNIIIDCFGGVHSVGSGTVAESGSDVSGERYYSINELISNGLVKQTIVSGEGVSAGASAPLGFAHYCQDGGKSSSINKDEKLYCAWKLGKNNDGQYYTVQDGISMMQTKLNYLQYAYLCHANGCYIYEISGCDVNDFKKNVLGWKEGSLNPATDSQSVETLNKRLAVVRYYDFDIFTKNGRDPLSMKYIDWSVEGGAAGATYVGAQGSANYGSQQYYQTQGWFSDVFAEEWTTVNTVLERNLSDLLFLHYGDETTLKSKEQMALEGWIDNTETPDTTPPLVKALRIIVQVVGMISMVWGILFYLAFWFDTLNNFFNISLVSLLTLGKMAVGEDSGKTVVNSKKAITIFILTVGFGFLAFSGLLYKGILTVVSLVKNWFT